MVPESRPGRWGGAIWSTMWDSGLDQPLADGVAHEGGRLADAELLHEPGAVGPGRLNAHPQEPGDLLRRLPFGYELEDLALSGGQGNPGGRSILAV